MPECTLEKFLVSPIKVQENVPYGGYDIQTMEQFYGDLWTKYEDEWKSTAVNHAKDGSSISCAADTKSAQFMVHHGDKFPPTLRKQAILKIEDYIITTYNNMKYMLSTVSSRDSIPQLRFPPPATTSIPTQTLPEPSNPARQTQTNLPTPSNPPTQIPANPPTNPSTPTPTLAKSKKIKVEPIDIANVLQYFIDMKLNKYKIPSMVDEVVDCEHVKPYDLDEHPTLCVNTACGMGKSQNIIEVVKLLREGRIICYTFRVSLVNKTDTDLREFGFVRYDTIKVKTDGDELIIDDRPVSHKGIITDDKAIVQIDSICRVHGKYDVVILDEFKYTLAHIINFVKDKEKVLQALRDQIRACKKVIVLDSYLDNDEIEFLKECGKTPYFYYNSFKKHQDIKLVIKENKSQLSLHIENLVRNQFKVAVPTNSKSYATTLQAHLLKMFPQLKLGIFSSDTMKSNKDDPVSTWSNYDVIIYTPVICAGSSFVEEHFDYVCAYFTPMSSCAELSCQQLFRVRNIKQKEIVICVDTRKQQSLGINSVSDAQQFLVRRYQSHYRQVVVNDDVKNEMKVMSFCVNNYAENTIDTNSPLFKLLCKNTFSMNESNKNYLLRMIYLLDRQGIDFDMKNFDKCEKTKELKDHEDNFKQLSKEITDQENLAVSTAEVVTLKQAIEMDKKVDLTVEESLSCKKTWLLHNLHVDPASKITPDFVKVYSKKIQQHHRLEKILPLKDLGNVNLNEALDRILDKDHKLIIETTPVKPDPTEKKNLTLRNSYLKIVYGCNLLRFLGFDSPFDTRNVKCTKIPQPPSILQDGSTVKTPDISDFHDKLDLAYKYIFTGKIWFIYGTLQPQAKTSDSGMVKYINKLLESSFGVKLFGTRLNQSKKTGEKHMTYRIEGIKKIWDVKQTRTGQILVPMGYNYDPKLDRLKIAEYFGSLNDDIDEINKYTPQNTRSTEEILSA